jgi:hypothetical protein
MSFVGIISGQTMQCEDRDEEDRQCRSTATLSCCICGKVICENHSHYTNEGKMCKKCALALEIGEKKLMAHIPPLSSKCCIRLCPNFSVHPCEICGRGSCQTHSHWYKYPPGQPGQKWICEECNIERNNKRKEEQEERGYPTPKSSPPAFLRPSQCMYQTHKGPCENTFSSFCVLCQKGICEEHLTLTTLGNICVDCQIKNRVPHLGRAKKITPTQTFAKTLSRTFPIREITPALGKQLTGSGVYLEPGGVVVELGEGEELSLTEKQFKLLFRGRK